MNHTPNYSGEKRADFSSLVALHHPWKPAEIQGSEWLRRKRGTLLLACALWLQLNQLSSTTRTSCSGVAQPRCTGITPVGLYSPISVTIHESTAIDRVTANHIQIESPSHSAYRCAVRAETIRQLHCRASH